MSSSPAAQGSAPSAPGHGERARTLLARARLGTLCTLSREPAGHPFGSIVCYALTAEGDPLLLTSDLAEHTKNFLDDPRASLLVADPGASDPLAAERVTLLGRVIPVGAEEREALGGAYLEAVPEAARYAGFKDFRLYRLAVEEVRYVGGFGRMSWVPLERYRESRPDPLAGHQAGILQHMNEDHAEAMVLMCRHHAGVDGREPRMLSVDRLGFEVSLDTPEGRRPVRVAFLRPVSGPEEVRREMVALVRVAREGRPPAEGGAAE